MMPIRVLSQELVVLAEIDDYESMQFTRRWHKPGEFELHINVHKNNTDQLQKNNLVMLGAETTKVGIITHRHIALGETGKGQETLTVRGPSLSGITQRRITIPPSGQAYDAITDEAETVLKHYIENNLSSPADNDRGISMLSIDTDQKRGGTITWQSRYKNLAEELEAISRASALGWNVFLDLGVPEMVFEVYEGTNRTTEQSETAPVIMSPKYDAIRTMEYAESDVEYRNVGYTAGQGEGDAREVVEVGSSSGLERREVFFDARDVDNTSDLTARGEQRLAEKATDIYLSGTVLESCPFIYEEDYDLGDRVTVQNDDWTVTLHTRITEIKEVYEPAGMQLEMVFGSNAPDLIAKIKNEFKEVEKEVRR